MPTAGARMGGSGAARGQRAAEGASRPVFQPRGSGDAGASALGVGRGGWQPSLPGRLQNGDGGRERGRSCSVSHLDAGPGLPRRHQELEARRARGWPSPWEAGSDLAGPGTWRWRSRDSCCPGACDGNFWVQGTLGGWGAGGLACTLGNQPESEPPWEPSHVCAPWGRSGRPAPSAPKTGHPSGSFRGGWPRSPSQEPVDGASSLSGPGRPWSLGLEYLRPSRPAGGHQANAPVSPLCPLGGGRSPVVELKPPFHTVLDLADPSLNLGLLCDLSQRLTLSGPQVPPSGDSLGPGRLGPCGRCSPG